MSHAQPPVWTSVQFDEALEQSIVDFRAQRLNEAKDGYVDAYEIARQSVCELLEQSVDLTTIFSEAVEITTNSEMLEALRYLSGPPISTDDLKILADVPTLGAASLRNNPDLARKVVETVWMGLDSARFSWVQENRLATDEEREIAIVATSAMIAYRKVQTQRASDSKTMQEGNVGAYLEEAQFTQVDPRTIRTLFDAPNPGEFCSESDVGGRKADLVVRLWDGRFMPIECKVSSSATNSVKRLNNDAAAKAKQWIEQFGRAQTIPTAFIAGVFKRNNLEQAQRQGLTIFWSHRPQEFIQFLDSTRI